MTAEEATVFIVDDDPVVLKSLRWLLESDHLKVEIFNSAQAFLDAYDASRPGCLVLDVRMPGMSGVELQQALKERQAAIPIIFITAYGEVPTAVRCLNEGAVDFIEKPYDDAQLLARVHAALEMDARSRREGLRRQEAEARIAQLTPRERQVMDLIVQGLSNKQIAQQLQINEKTVAVHRSNMMTKLQADSVVDVIRQATMSRPG